LWGEPNPVRRVSTRLPDFGSSLTTFISWLPSSPREGGEQAGDRGDGGLQGLAHGMAGGLHGGLLCPGELHSELCSGNLFAERNSIRGGRSGVEHERRWSSTRSLDLRLDDAARVAAEAVRLRLSPRL
jgi:hypothetical protein